MSDDQVKQSIAELQDLVRCRCHPAYKDRGMHDPDCDCDSADAVQVVVDHIEELDDIIQHDRERIVELVSMVNSKDARIEELEANAMKASNAAFFEKRRADEAQAKLDNTAEAIWAEFKDKFEGERKYALRQIVKWLKGERDE
jgi:hypothetical protein